MHDRCIWSLFEAFDTLRKSTSNVSFDPYSVYPRSTAKRHHSYTFDLFQLPTQISGTFVFQTNYTPMLYQVVIAMYIDLFDKLFDLHKHTERICRLNQSSQTPVVLYCSSSILSNNLKGSENICFKYSLYFQNSNTENIYIFKKDN